MDPASKDGAVSDLRSKVTLARGDATSTDHMQNLAYVVSSANDNIQALQRTIKQQEQELAASRDHAAALQRNYETLARVRRADQEEFLVLKTQRQEEHAEMVQLKADLTSERARCSELERSLEESAAAQAEAQSLQQQLGEVTRERNEHAAEVERLREGAAEMVETNKVLKINIDKLSRAQQEMLTKARKADDALRALQVEKDAAERALASATSRMTVQERQLKTFLQANEALEADLRKQLARVAALERRKQEQEAEQQTIEAYYQARLEEMQGQYEKLLAEIDDAKRDAQVKVYKGFEDNAEVVPVDRPRQERGLSNEGGKGLSGGSPIPGGGSPGGGGRVRPSPSKKG